MQNTNAFCAQGTHPVQDLSNLNGLQEHAVCKTHSKCGTFTVHQQTDSTTQMQRLDTSGKYHTSNA